MRVRPKATTRSVNSNTRLRNNRESGSAIVGALIAMAVIGVVTSFMVGNTGNRSLLSRSFRDVQTAQLSVNNGIVGTMSYFHNTDSADMLNMLNSHRHNNVNGQTRPSFIIGKGPSNHVKVGDGAFNSQMTHFDQHRGNDYRATFRINSDKNVKNADAFFMIGPLEPVPDPFAPTVTQDADGGSPLKSAFYTAGGGLMGNAGLNVNGDATFNGPGEIRLQNADNHVKGKAYFGGSLVVPANKRIRIDKAAYIMGTGNFQGLASVGDDLYVGEMLHVEGGGASLNVLGRLTVKGYTDAQGGSMTIAKDAFLGTGLFLGNGRASRFDGKTFVGGNAILRSLGSDTLFRNDVGFNGTLDLETQQLRVSGKVYLNGIFNNHIISVGTVDINKTVYRTGNIPFYNPDGCVFSPPLSMPEWLVNNINGGSFDEQFQTHHFLDGTHSATCLPHNNATALNHMVRNYFNTRTSTFISRQILDTTVKAAINVDTISPETITPKPEPRLDVSKILANEKVVPVNMNTIVTGSNFNNANAIMMNLHAAFEAAQQAEQLYNGHLVVDVTNGYTLPDFRNHELPAGTKVIFNVTNNGGMDMGGRSFFSNAEGSQTMIYLSGNSYLDNFNVMNGDFRGFIYADEGSRHPYQPNAGPISFNWASKSQGGGNIYGAIHDHSGRGIMWNGCEDCQPEINYDGKILDAYSDLVESAELFDLIVEMRSSSIGNDIISTNTKTYSSGTTIKLVADPIEKFNRWGLPSDENGMTIENGIQTEPLAYEMTVKSGQNITTTKNTVTITVYFDVEADPTNDLRATPGDSVKARAAAYYFR